MKEALSQERLEKKPFILPVGEAGESGQTPRRRGDLSLESQDFSGQRLGNLGCKANGDEAMSLKTEKSNGSNNAKFYTHTHTRG